MTHYVFARNAHEAERWAQENSLGDDYVHVSGYSQEGSRYVEGDHVSYSSFAHLHPGFVGLRDMFHRNLVKSRLRESADGRLVAR